MTLSIQQLWDKYSVDGYSINKERFERLIRETSMRQNVRFAEELEKIIPDGSKFIFDNKVVGVWDCIHIAQQKAKEVQP